MICASYAGKKDGGLIEKFATRSGQVCGGIIYLKKFARLHPFTSIWHFFKLFNPFSAS
jgi:hypothetical protein